MKHYLQRIICFTLPTHYQSYPLILFLFNFSIKCSSSFLLLIILFYYFMQKGSRRRVRDERHELAPLTLVNFQDPEDTTGN